MPLNNIAYSSSSFSSSSSSSQLSTPRYLLQLKSPLLDVEKVKCSSGFSVSKSKEELIRQEIVVLEREIFMLEGYLLSLYRTSIGDHLSSLLLPRDSSPCLKTPSSIPYTTKFQVDEVSYASEMSLPPSYTLLSETDKIKRTESCNPSLADLLGLNTRNPNKLSEEILRHICVIYLKLADKGHNRSVRNSNNENINEECAHELGIVIHKHCLDDNNLNSVESMLHNFRTLVQKLEIVVPTMMAREEKLAFWINIHNALVMHGYIVYGISDDRTKKMVMKAAFNIGGEWINAYDIQSSILGIRVYHSSSRLRKLFSPARSSRTSSCGHTYALDYTEPLLHFSLSTGASSDPMVRVYTAEGIFQELRQARDEFIKTSVDFEKDKMILLPKIIYNYAKDISVDMAELFNTISECLTETKRRTMIKVFKKNQDRCIRWINNDSKFRYIIDWELVRESL
ncbi:unnamed protein product [Cochlearia groenlandica]